MFRLYFNIFIYSLIILQSMTVSASVLVSNISVLIQFCCLYCVYQIVCLADICNVINVCWCDYCCLLNKLCCLMSSMQDVKKSLMLKRFCLISILLPITFFINIITLTIRQQIRIIIIAMLHFIMWYRKPSLISFKLIKLLL